MPRADLPLADRYRLERPIGRGGMAEVWMARDELLDRDVAVKLLSSRFREDEQFQVRFSREARQAASLNHPNVVAVYDTGTHDGLPFIVMELVAGRSLQQVLTRGGLTEERTLEVCAEVCSALEYAHHRGLVHRDIKPGNILLSDDGAVKVTDFGIARAVATDTATQTAAVFGTAAYLSPEQAQGAAVDARSDIYSLGVVLYELLTGRPPFVGENAVGVAYQHVQEDPLPPREIDSSISPSAEAVAMKALAKNPANRYQSAAEMRDDLLRVRSGRRVTAPAVLPPDETAVLETREFVTAGRPPLTDTQQRRRHAVGYGLLAFLAVAGTVGALWLLARWLGAGETATVTVPKVINDTPQQAEAALEALGLEVTFVGNDYSDDIEAGRVMRQDPHFGTQVPEGTEVQLTLSEGREPVAVPEVEGMEEEAAIAALRRAGLAFPKREHEFSDEVDKGKVITTRPGPGETVDKGSTVTLVISAGEETEIVPNVEGLIEADARAQLREREFNVLVTREHSDTVGEGIVIRQDPGPMTEARKGSDVAIVVSLGPANPSPSPTPSEPTASPSPDDGDTEEPTPEPTPSGIGLAPPGRD